MHKILFLYIQFPNKQKKQSNKKQETLIGKTKKGETNSFKLFICMSALGQAAISKETASKNIPAAP